MKQISIRTRSRTQFLDITHEVAQAVAELAVAEGVVTVFVPHTTAGITINEHADPDVVADMGDVLDDMVPWENNYRHMEGNAAAHVKASLLGSSARVIVSGGHMQLGTWQGVFFCEFDGPRSRQVWVSAG